MMRSCRSCATIARQGTAWVFRAAPLIAVGALFVAYDTFFVVSERGAAVTLRLGQPVREIIEPGIYAKWPTPIERVNHMDLRKRLLSTPATGVFTRDKRNILVSTYVVWNISKPLAFLQALGTEQLANSSLTSMATAAVNEEIAQHPLDSLISTEIEILRTIEIERAILQSVRAKATERLGVHVEQVRIERISFPQENVAAVLDRMRVEREGEASRIRAEGAKSAQAIRDAAHIESQEILREGREKANRLAVDAERYSAELMASSQQADPDFFRYWSDLQASAKALKNNSTLVLTADRLFFGPILDGQFRENREREPITTSTGARK